MDGDSDSRLAVLRSSRQQHMPRMGQSPAWDKGIAISKENQAQPRTVPLSMSNFVLPEQRRNGSRIAPLTPEDADQITTAAQRTTSTEPWSPARSSIVRRGAAQGIRKTVLWKARTSLSGKENRSENGRSGRNHFAAAAACQINQKQPRWLTLTALYSCASRARRNRLSSRVRSRILCCAA